MSNIASDFIKRGEIRILSENQSYVYSSDTYCNTKRQHGLFVTKIAERENIYHVLLSSLDETIYVNNCDYQLAHHRFPFASYLNGNIYISHHDTESIFTTYYYMGPYALKKEILLSDDEPAIYIRYTVLESEVPIKICLSPFLAFRSIFLLSKCNSLANTDVEQFATGISSKMYNNFPNLHMQLSGDYDFVYKPSWHYNFEYVGNPDYIQEDLFTPGNFEFWMNKNQSYIFSASLKKILDFGIIEELFKPKLNEKTQTLETNKKSKYRKVFSNRNKVLT